MPFIEWSPEYSVGIRVIDNDHRELFDLVNQLHEGLESHTASTSITQTIDRLIRYVKEHFQREEGLMYEYGYPGLEAHRKKHNEFVWLVSAIRKIEIECPHRLDGHKLLSFLSTWLKSHIMKTDRDYLPYLSSKPGEMIDAHNYTEPVALMEPASQADEMTEVSVLVPADRVDILRRCGAILRAGGPAAASLYEIANPISAMTTEDALQIADALLRKN